MSEHLVITANDKSGRYLELLPQLEALCIPQEAPLAALCNAVAALHTAFPRLWTGLYLYSPRRDALTLGPFQGPLACTEIKKNRGVCGTAWAEDRLIVVPDVDLFPGHIACSSESRSELVVPIHDSAQRVVGVIDIDDRQTNAFDTVDATHVARIADIIAPHAAALSAML